MLEENNGLHENAAALPYRTINGLIYYKDLEIGLHLDVPSTDSIEKELFQQAHNKMRHLRYIRTHKCLTKSLYFFNLFKKLYEFIWSCLQCQLCQTPRHKSYGALQPILIPSRPFHIISLDFILSLPTTPPPDEFDCIMSITDKFSKAVIYISGKIT